MIFIQEIIILLVLINIFDKNIMFLYLNCAEIFKFVEKWGALGAIYLNGSALAERSKLRPERGKFSYQPKKISSFAVTYKNIISNFSRI